MESAYVLNKASIFKLLAKSGSTQLLMSVHAAEQSAMLLQRDALTSSVAERRAVLKTSAHAAEHANPSPSEGVSTAKQNPITKPEDKGAILERMLLERVQQLLGTLRRSHTLCLKEDEALKNLDQVVAFIRSEAAATAFEILRGKPCYSLSRSSVSGQSTSSPTKPAMNGVDASLKQTPMGKVAEPSNDVVGIVRHKRTFLLMLALDRLFAYKGLYHE
ncbi:hypothetical protein AMS68_006114 [Peltaster fructicola]|uniref:Uncharacterized protein n=1 Tax=Peltaster fructicola TaxID=286661 RepID=A0A6H0Y0R6_9PEZI|nr:hypothetical protein AMS68_006114 [Peltaster fructicola]